MKNSKKLLVLAVTTLLLVACGGGKKNSSNRDDGSLVSSANTSSLVSGSSSEGRDESSSRRAIPGGSSSSSKSSTNGNSSSSAKSSSSKNTNSSQEIPSDDIPVLFKITLHADSKNEGLTVTASSGSYAGKEVVLTVNLTNGYILEYIRLYAPTAAEGGVRVKPDAQGRYVFTMPNQNVDIYYKGVKGYSVVFASNHATAELASDSAEYDLFGEGYPVYVCKKSVDSGYYFKGFEVKDANGNKIDTWQDAVDQVGFLMPKGNVTVTAIGEKIDTSLASIAGTYTGGVSIDMNDIGDPIFKLVVGLDNKVTFSTDWANPDWSGYYTYKDNVLEADITNLSQDGYFTDTTRHLKVTFMESGKYLATEFSSNTVTYRYLLGKPSEGLMAKRLYMSALQNGDYTKAHRIVSFSSMSGDFFTYVNPTRTSANFYLKAYEKEGGAEAFSFTKDKTYIMKDSLGTSVIEVSYNGTNITVSEPTNIEPGPGGEGGDIEDKDQTPFMGKTYSNNKIKIYDDDGTNPVEYEFKISFSSTFGSISSVSLTPDPTAWMVPLQKLTKSDLTYTWDEETGAITVTGLKSGSQTTILSYQENGTIIYKGKVWNTDNYICSNNQNIVLSEVK